jgi:excisionase family DNA binding protein
MSIEALLAELVTQQRETNRLLAQSLMREEWVSLQEAATRANVSIDTVRRKVLAKEWPARRIGRSWRVDINSVLRGEGHGA